MENRKPMRILHVVTHMERGGLETMLMNYYRHMDRTKVQFDFLVHRSQYAAYDREIEALGGIIYRLPVLVPWSISYRKALNSFFAEHPEYKIVHVHQDCLSSVILKAAKKHGVPVRIGHSHNSSQDKNIKYLIKLFYRKRIPLYATDLFACGKQAGDWMFNGASYRIIHNAIDVESYRYQEETARRVRREWNIPENVTVYGHVGRFCHQKNHSFLIDIFARLYEKKPDARLLLVGDGELRSQIEEKIRKLHLENSVILTGVRSDVHKLLQAMNVFLFPSHYEGLGIVAVEAQATGLPCFVSDGVPDECKMTEHFRKISLNCSASQWAEQILTAADERDTDTLERIHHAGYDIKSNAIWLQNYYLEAVKYD